MAKSNIKYQLLRFFALLKKEFIIIRRDYITYIFLILIPLSEVILFGYVIKTDANQLPTAVIIPEISDSFTNSILQAFKNTDYFKIIAVSHDQRAMQQLFDKGKVLFVITFPAHFTRDLIAKREPHILLEGNAIDPIAVQSAFHSTQGISDLALQNNLVGPFQYLKASKSTFIIDKHAKYNPGIVSQYHTLPGLIVTILTLALIVTSAVTITGEYEQGTMESLLVTPLQPLEVILGKIIPNVIIGYILLFLTVIISRFLFKVPFEGSFLLLCLVAFPFLIANLGIGVAVSTFAKTQFQAANFANTYNLPALLLSGFLFPFYGMPYWAQWIGNILPPTHFLRIISNIMLKGSDFFEIWPDVWPILLFLVFILFISFKNYRNTLD